jgi:hypothetical protein
VTENRLSCRVPSGRSKKLLPPNARVGASSGRFLGEVGAYNQGRDGVTKGVRLLFVGLVVCGISLAASSDPAAAVVEYVKICTLYGAGFHYIPGTDICLNEFTNDARQQTEGGTWRWRIPNNPRRWVQSPEEGCQDGQLVSFGTVRGSDLSLNSHKRYETDDRLRVTRGQLITAVMYRGGFRVGRAGNFCMFYQWQHPMFGLAYSFPLGCIDTGGLWDIPATLVFVPDRPLFTEADSDVYLVGANGDQWPVPPPSDPPLQIEGALSIWLCVQDLHPVESSPGLSPVSPGPRPGRPVRR